MNNNCQIKKKYKINNKKKNLFNALKKWDIKITNEGIILKYKDAL